MRTSSAIILTLYFFAFYLTLSILFKPSLAATPDESIFTTKSGKKIKTKLITRYAKFFGGTNLKSKLAHMIFEYDADSNSLSSFHRTIYLPNASNRSKITLSPIVNRYYQTNVKLKNSKKKELRVIKFPSVHKSNVFMSKLANGDTFLFNAEKNYALIAAFGDALDLHSINHFGNKVFLNHYIPPKLSNRNIKHSLKPRNCKRVYELSVHVISDHFMCSRFGGKDFIAFYMIEQFIFQSIKTFMDMACVDIRLMGITSYCRWTKDFNFKQSQCDSTNRSKAKCQISPTEHIMKEMMNYELRYEGDREFMLFISGLNNPGRLAGLTYKSRACDVRLSNIWIKGLSRVAFNHEIGHLLGANHVRDGIMQPTVSITEGLRFSKRSENEISRFVEKDSRSWCLRRRYSSTLADISEDGWVKKKLLLPYNRISKNLRFESISTASLSSHRKNDLILLITDTKYQGNGPEIKLFYGSVQNVWSILRFPAEKKIKYKSLGLEFSRHSRFSLRFFPSTRFGKKGVILSYLDSRKFGRPIPHYRVGSVKSSGNIDIDSWSKDRDIGNVDYFYPNRKAVDIDLIVGNIRNKKSVDLLYMQLNTETKDFYGMRKTLKYKIGYNMNTIGIVQSGWSDYYTILGDFDRAESMSASVMDVDNNGKPDLVIYIAEYRTLARPLGYTYFRVGKDLSPKGIVKGGWTDHHMTLGTENGKYHERSMDVAWNLKSRQAVLISAQRGKLQEVKLTVSQNDIFKKVMRTAKKYSAIESVVGNCEICFGGISVKKCKQKMDLCKSRIDKLIIYQDLPRKRISGNSKMEMNYRKFGLGDNYVQESSYRSVEFFSEAANYNNLNISDSIFCTGFQYFLDNGDFCNTIDARSVYSKGLEITFTNYLNESIMEEDITSTSLFEDLFGTSGNGDPIIVQLKIRGRKSPVAGKIKDALRKSLTKQQIPKKLFFENMKSETGKALYKTKRYWNKYQKIWIVTFVLSEAGSEIF